MAKTLKHQIDQIKFKLNRFSNFIDTFDCTSSNFDELECRLDDAKKLLNEFESAMTSLEIKTGFEENSAEDDTERSFFETTYYRVISRAKGLLTQQVSIKNCDQKFITNTKTSEVRLPILTLPKFNGSYDQWFQFHDTFKSLVNDDPNLSNVQKFYYLKSCLQGDAANVLQSIEVTNNNYSMAWDLLRERFDNKRLIIKNHVKSLFNLESIHKESHSSLRALIDNYKRHIRSLSNLGQPTDKWDTLLIYLICTKLDQGTMREWEKHSTCKDLNKIDDLIIFLNQRCMLLEGLCSDNKNNKTYASPNFTHNKGKPVTNDAKSYVSNQLKCTFCTKSHLIYNCEDLLKLSIQNRINEVKRLRLCINCLKAGHTVSSCRAGKCKLCSKPHNTLLHLPVTNQEVATRSVAQNDAKPSTSTNISNSTVPGVASANHTVNASQVLLSTAYVQVFDQNNESFNLRVLLDNGSQSNFITSTMCNKLQLPVKDANVTIGGVGQNFTHISKIANVRIHSRHNSFKQNVSCLVIPKITEDIPSQSFDIINLAIPPNVVLADPSFNKSSQVDLLLGADIFWDLLCVGQINLGKNKPIVQKSKLGWIVSGALNMNSFSKSYCNFNQFLENQVTKFWELEEIRPDIKYRTQQERLCETIFTDTTKRDPSGRFTVRLPFNENIAKLGESRQQALNRFYSLERKLNKNDDLKQQYHLFMAEYESLGHMTKCDSTLPNEQDYFLPHHAVLKENSLTSKIRVVFDGSSKTNTNLSLNDCLMTGPILQDDIFTILSRFRCYSIVLTADVAKMYRQVLVHKSDRRYQKIFWRYATDEPLREYTLNTVTYGTTPASFLAVRSLQQVAFEHAESHPQASYIILNGFYVDDLICGFDSVEEAIKVQGDISFILKTCGFELRKWVSNSPKVLQVIPHDSETSVLQFSENENYTTLGLQWNSVQDSLQYSFNGFNFKLVTKRSILSCISQIFDPLGLLGPIVITAKLIIQSLWQLKLDWDESIPFSLHNMWLQLSNNLNAISSVVISRGILVSHAEFIELHGFSDASERAYGACIYIKSKNKKGEVQINLLCAKSRVAPLRTVSLPRLELCAALLLTRLADKITNNINLKFDSQSYWCDSTIVLSWIKSQSAQLKTFVANRVSEIQDTTVPEMWHHVKSEDNPADLLSRGVDATALSNNSFWWQGPSWLQNDTYVNLNEPPLISVSELPEKRKKLLVHHVSSVNTFDLFDKYSNFNKLQRVTAYIFRFISNCRLKREARKTGCLTVSELDIAVRQLIKIAQEQGFASEIADLTNKPSVSKRSNLLPLNPFLDDSNIIRVGGRLGNSCYNYDKRYPILLPQRHALTTLIMRDYHTRFLHCGSQALLAAVRDTYWPICGKSVAKMITRECIKCYKTRPKIATPLMGNLPAARVNPSRPFLNTGVDYAGPFMTRDRKTRGFKLVKSYICVFVCFATKAIHIELVSNLTSECFLAAFRRFISRRGICLNIYSDNGTNFVGANSELAELSNFLQNIDNQNNIINSTTKISTTWHFVPPKSPHFGGLWEAGVKSVKQHLKRVLGNAHLTYEEFYTVLTQIEACLNSRPLCPLSEDPNDLNILTPGHFLIGDSMNSLPDPNLLEVTDNRLSRFQRCQRLAQHFWQRWSKEYVSNLQTRSKWKTSTMPDIKSGMMVLLQEENLPPLKWKMGRIMDVHPGTDNVVRVVSVKTTSGIYKRAVTKLSILPIDI